MKKALLIAVVLFLALVSWLFAAGESKNKDTQKGPNEKIVSLTVSGLKTPEDARKAEAALRKLDGVNHATFSHLRGEAVVRFDTTKTSVDKLTAAVAEEGFKATFKEDLRDGKQSTPRKGVKSE